MQQTLHYTSYYKKISTVINRVMNTPSTVDNQNKTFDNFRPLFRPQVINPINSLLLSSS